MNVALFGHVHITSCSSLDGMVKIPTEFEKGYTVPSFLTMHRPRYKLTHYTHTGYGIISTVTITTRQSDIPIRLQVLQYTQILGSCKRR